ncbi:ATP-grasp fold amidoligase family protein [Gayadomonas joobiniege]|uniref:ATP-grasp fold amidoligase family protein n=1 Tax=Gayadomonas joobiniege TaxID=1234606 RepID=UPI00037B80CC|nr:ATP-grasp fold amidoligase family protein [Gayadomonas joobiniege]
MFNWSLFKTKIRFYKKLGYWPNIEQPKTFNEKIQHRKFYAYNNPLYSLCADKYRVREYVTNKIGEQHLIPLLDVVDKPEQLNLNAYGERFVIKTTHDSGGVFVCRRGKVNTDQLFKKLEKHLSRDAGKKRNEHWYSEIQPKIIVEACLLDNAGNLPNDYKFHIFNASEKTEYYLQVDYDRGSQHKRSMYDHQRQLTDIGLGKKIYQRSLGEIKNYPLMVELAKSLAADFDYVRVDLYNINGHIYFGELTFAHGSGFRKFSPKKYDCEWGQLWPEPTNQL